MMNWGDRELESGLIFANLDAVKTVKDGNSELGWEFRDWNPRDSFERDEIEGSKNLSELLRRFESTLEYHGYAILQFDAEQFKSADAPFLVTKLLSLLGQPIRIFKSETGHWRKVDVDLTRPMNRSRGTGELALHMDFVNADDPPDLICLLCLNEDPRGEGFSLISKHDGIEGELTSEVVSLLSEKTFRDGKVVDLLNVGNDCNPFAILSKDAKWRFRYTANLGQVDYLPKIALAIDQLSRALQKRVVRFKLQRNQLLIVDQHKALHGREPVGLGQEELEPADRRLVLHSFIRRNR